MSGSDQKWQNRNQLVKVTLISNQKSGTKAFAQAVGPALQSALLMPCTSKQAVTLHIQKATATVKLLLTMFPVEPVTRFVRDSKNSPQACLETTLKLLLEKPSLIFREKQSGGAVTAILTNALDIGLVDAVVTVTEDPWTLKPHSMVITKSEALIRQAGSRYNWWVPLVSSLKEAVVNRKYRNIAVVGVPCVVQAVRKMLETDHQLVHPYKKSIRFVLGLFCTESFDYEKLIAGKLKSEYALEPMNVCRIDVKGKLEITLNGGKQYIIPLTELQDTIRPGCSVCTDFTALKADISAGSVGSPEGYTTLIVRTLVGQHILESAVANKKLSVGGEVNLDIIEKLAKKKMARKTQ